MRHLYFWCVACWKWHVIDTKYTINMISSRHSIVYATWKLWLNGANFQMLWLGDYSTSHIVSMNGLNIPWMWVSANVHLWVSMNTYGHIMNVIEGMWLGVNTPWMQFTAQECLWVMKTPHKHNWVQANTFWMSIEHPWMQSSAHEWLWVSIEKWWMCTRISQIYRVIQIESIEYWHQFTENHVMFQW